MGKFFNTLHVKSSNKEAFVKGFEWIMKKEGFVPCDNDEAEITFAAAFSEGGWVSLSNGEPSADGLARLSERLAKDLLLPSFTVEAVDSDFAILELCSPDKKTKFRKSRLVVGDGEGYGVEKAPILIDDWRPLFQNGGVEEFLAAAGQDGAFVEDALCELGKVLGIKPAVMAWCFDEFEEKIGCGEVISLMFKKKAEKKLTLNAAFKQVFGEALEPLGFKPIKSKFPYFVRVVPGGEIVHVISFYKDQSFDPQCNSINIVGGVATVYRPKIDLLRNPKGEIWLIDNEWIYSQQHPINSDNIGEHFYRFVCSADEQKMLKDLHAACEITSQIMVRMLDKAATIDACIELSQEIGMSLHLYDENLENDNPRHYYNEGFLYFKTDKNIFRKTMMDAISDIALREKSFFEKVHSDPELYSAVKAELERRRKENIERLREYGLEI